MNFCYIVDNTYSRAKKLYFIIDVTPLVSKMQLFLKFRIVLSWLSGIDFAYVTDQIVPGVFLSQLAGINFRIEKQQYSV